MARLARPVGCDARSVGAQVWRCVGVGWLAIGCVACGPPRGTIGAVLARQPNGELIVREVPDRLAASKAGLEPGDQVLLIDGKDVRAMSAEQVHQALSGDVGAAVKLTVVRGDEVVRMTVKRSPARPRQRSAPR
jgi:C-terminal processing protease CtpA/Prc